MTWPDMLASAAAPEGVIEIARVFLSGWTPEELAALPAGCLPPSRFRVPEDVVLYAYTLAQHRCKPNGDTPEVLRMANFFLNASQRITRLMSDAKRASAANAPFAR